MFLIDLAIAVLSFVIGFWWRGNRQFAPNMGEALVANVLERQVALGGHLFNNVTLTDSDGSTTQIDHILICPWGILVAETKHYSGWVFGCSEDRTWTQVFYKSKCKFSNPRHQNARHVRIVRGLFKLPPEMFHSLVVFSGNAVLRSTNKGEDVIYLQSLQQWLEQPRQQILNANQIIYAVGRIEMARMQRSVQTDEYHLNSVRARVGGRSGSAITP